MVSIQFSRGDPPIFSPVWSLSLVWFAATFLVHVQPGHWSPYKKWENRLENRIGFRRFRFRFSPTNQSIDSTHRIHGAAIYGNMDPINIPPFFMLPYIPAPWIHWQILTVWFFRVIQFSGFLKIFARFPRDFPKKNVTNKPITGPGRPTTATQRPERWESPGTYSKLGGSCLEKYGGTMTTIWKT